MTLCTPGEPASTAQVSAPHLHVVPPTPPETSVARVVYGRRSRPLVEARVGDVWYRGRLTGQLEGPDGWWMYVRHYLPESRTVRLARFAPGDVRRVSARRWQRQGQPGQPGQPSAPGPDAPDEPPPDNPSGHLG